MDNKPDKTKNNPNRDKRGFFTKGNEIGALGGRPVETPERKLEKKAIKEYISEYKERLAQALPLIDPVLIKKAEEGDVPAIKEIHDRVMGKAPQNIDHTSKGDKIIPIFNGLSKDD